MKKSIVFSILAAIAAPTWALSTDKSQPIEVHADQFNGDEVKQTAVYSGNVVVDQGSMNLTGARLDLAITPKGYRRATITGSPARFKQQRDPKTKGVEEWVHAHASRITYDEETDKVTLEGKAQLLAQRKRPAEGHDERRAHRLRHAQRRSEVNSGEGKRVTTIIAPRSKTDAGTQRQGTSLSNSTKLQQ